jgi:hypothetical protein
MKPARLPILARRRGKRAAEKAQAAAERAREQARVFRELSRKHLLVNVASLAPTNSYSTPTFAERGYYVDQPFICKACGSAEVWTEAQQKWWYEIAKGDVFSQAILCRPCRKREQARRAAARAVHLAGLAAKGGQKTED